MLPDLILALAMFIWSSSIVCQAACGGSPLALYEECGEFEVLSPFASPNCSSCQACIDEGNICIKDNDRSSRWLPMDWDFLPEFGTLCIKAGSRVEFIDNSGGIYLGNLQIQRKACLDRNGWVYARYPLHNDLDMECDRDCFVTTCFDVKSDICETDDNCWNYLILVGDGNGRHFAVCSPKLEAAMKIVPRTE